MKKYFKIFQIIFISLVYICPISVYSEEKIKVGLLIPMTGDDKKLGKLIIDSIVNLDRPVVVAYLLFVVTLFLILNLVVDILYAALDPRVRQVGEK